MFARRVWIQAQYASGNKSENQAKTHSLIGNCSGIHVANKHTIHLIYRVNPKLNALKEIFIH